MMGDNLNFILAAHYGNAADVARLLADGVDVNATGGNGATALHIASQQGHAEVVTKLLAANAEVNQANNDGTTPLFTACANGHTEVAAKLLAANATVDLVINDHPPALVAACFFGHLGIVQLLTSYGASRTFDKPAPYDTAEHIATHHGHPNVVAFLVRSRLWSTPLHHLELLTPERALALLRAGADIHAAAEPGGPTPLSLAQALAAAGGAAEGTAAFLVLEAAKPWSRKTHKYFPAPARERAVELLRVGQWFKRLPNDFPIPFEVWEVFVMPHEVTRDYEPPTRPQSPASA